MLSAFARALGQLGDGRILRLCAWAVVLALLLFLLLWGAVAWTLDHTHLVAVGWLDRALDWLGILATPVLAWFLFPTVLSGLLSLFLDATARAVELRHYPDLPPPTGLPFAAALWASLRLLLVLLALNVLLLPLLLLPPLYPPCWFLINGYLLGREYFELVALRRLQPAAARSLRRRHALESLLAGMATAMLLLVPLVNLLAPVLVTMAMVHLFEGWRRQEGRGTDGRETA